MGRPFARMMGWPPAGPRRSAAHLTTAAVGLGTVAWPSGIVVGGSIDTAVAEAADSLAAGAWEDWGARPNENDPDGSSTTPVPRHGPRPQDCAARSSVVAAERAGGSTTTLGGWPGVKITPMFGRWGYFAGEQLFACFPLREKDTDLWIRLGPERSGAGAARAGAAAAPPLRGARLDRDERGDARRRLPRARWLRRAYHNAERASTKGEATDG